MLHVYDKPMIYYPLCVLMMAGIRDILIISTPRDTPQFKRLLGDGQSWGINLSYAVQPSPGGLAQAFIIGADFVAGNSSALILGDNIFFGHDFSAYLRRAANQSEGATIFAYHVSDPRQYGVIAFDQHHRAISLEEKPEVPLSDYAVTGLYFYDPDVVDIAAGLKPSARGELEITDINKAYMARNRLSVEVLGRGFAWLDTGTPASLLAAASFVETIELRQGLKICCPEEVAYRMGFIDAAQLMTLGEQFAKSDYGKYLLRLLEQGELLRDESHRDADSRCVDSRAAGIQG